MGIRLIEQVNKYWSQNAIDASDDDGCVMFDAGRQPVFLHYPHKYRDTYQVATVKETLLTTNDFGTAMDVVLKYLEDSGLKESVT